MAALHAIHTSNRLLRTIYLVKEARFVCFVLGTIRTSTMRVIHAENCASSVYCSAQPLYQTNKCALDRRSDPPFHPATSRHLHPWIERVVVTKFVLQSPSQVREEAISDITSPVHGSCHTGPKPPCSLSHLHRRPVCRDTEFSPALKMTSLIAATSRRINPQRYRRLPS